MEAGGDAPLCAIVDIPGKGKGLIATKFIRRGTLIVAETPAMKIPAIPGENPDPLILVAAEAAGKEAVELLLTFPGTGTSYPETILSRMNNLLPLYAGDVECPRGLFRTICRANHSCQPNAEYSWNPLRQQEVLYALTDILAGQEVEVDYTLWDGQTDQRDILEQKFGFLCTCPSCSRPLDERRRSAERIRDYLKFVASFLKQLRTAPSPAALLLRLEQMTLLACEEGREWDVGARCYNGFQLCAYYGDLDASRQWAAAHRDAYILRRGSDCERAQKGAELARDPTQWSGWAQLGRRKLRGPSDTLSKIARQGCTPWLPEPASTGDVIAVQDHASVGLTKGQKKKAREKRKKAAQTTEGTIVDIEPDSH